MNEPKILVTDMSPNGNIEAIVEQDDRVVHMYLSGRKESSFGVRSCWVRNLKPAARSLDVDGMKEGIAPMMPRDMCRHPQGAPPLDPASLSIVWLEEGDAAAVLQGSDVLAIIPAWSGYKGFHGYARDCIGETPLAWELRADNAQLARLDAARQFWSSWEREITPWRGLQQQFCAAYEGQLGKEDKYYAIDGGQWPPKALLRIRTKDAVVQVTLGVSIRPQPTVEMYGEQALPYRRIELGMALALDHPAEAYAEAGRFLSGLANLPWNNYTWLGAGHTVDCTFLGNGYAAALLLPESAEAPRMDLPRQQDDPVSLLWVLPITEAERDMAQADGSQALQAELERLGRSWIH